MLIELDEMEIDHLQEALNRTASVENQKGDTKEAEVYWDIMKNLHYQSEADGLGDETGLLGYRTAIYKIVEDTVNFHDIRVIFKMAKLLKKMREEHVRI